MLNIDEVVAEVLPDLKAVTTKKIKQNLVFAFIYNLLGVSLAAGVLSPLFGISLSPIIGGCNKPPFYLR